MYLILTCSRSHCQSGGRFFMWMLLRHRYLNTDCVWSVKLRRASHTPTQRRNAGETAAPQTDGGPHDGCHPRHARVGGEGFNGESPVQSK